MSRSTWRLLAIFGLLCLAGCRKEEPNPELLDPIFMDLSRRASDAQKSLDDEMAKQKDLNVSIGKYEPRSPELRNARRDMEKSISMVREFGEQARYYQIRSKRRLFVDRITYKAAFAKNIQWPDPHEYSGYQVNMRLKEAKLNWSLRIPKLTDRIPSATKGQEVEKPKAKKAEE